MRVLFNQATPVPIPSFLVGHTVRTAMAGRTIAVVVIGVQRWPALQPHVALVVAAVNAATPGSFAEVDIPVE